MNSSNFFKHRKKELIFFNQAYEYFENVIKSETLDDKEIVAFQTEQEKDLSKSADHLRISMLAELDNLKDLILNNPNQKYNALSEEEKIEFNRFINFYSTCPICGQKNHWSNLKNLYFDEGKQLLIKKLKLFMDNKMKRSKKFSVNFGVPCCNCFKLHFEEDFL